MTKRSNLATELGLKGGSGAGKLPPAFLPKLRVRLASDRTRQVAEFLVDIPTEGFSGEAWEQCQAKMHAIFEAMGLLKARPKSEATHGESKEGPAQGQQE